MFPLTFSELSCVTVFLIVFIIHCRCVYSTFFYYLCVHSRFNSYYQSELTQNSPILSRERPFHSVTFSDSALGILCCVFQLIHTCFENRHVLHFLPCYKRNYCFLFAFSITFQQKLKKSVVWSNFCLIKLFLKAHIVYGGV